MQQPDTKEERDMIHFEQFHERAQFGDFTAFAAGLDYERVFSSSCLTAGDRQIVAMYLLNLTQDEMAELLGVSQQTLSNRVGPCLRHIIDALAGMLVLPRQRILKRKIDVSPTWDRWMDSVLHNTDEWWHVPDDVRQYIQIRFGTNPWSAVELTDYDDDSNEDPYKPRPMRSFLGKNRTFKGQRNEVRYIDEMSYEDEEDEEYRHQKSFETVDVKLSTEIKKRAGFWSAPSMNSEVITFFDDNIVKTQSVRLIDKAAELDAWLCIGDDSPSEPQVVI